MSTRLIAPRRFGVGLVALLITVLLASVAVAQIPDGRLQVDGGGSVTADGQLVVIGAASTRKGTATIRVTDRGGDAQVTVNGQAQTARRGQFVVRQSGRFLISGTSVSVQVNGDSLSLSIAGSGTVRMRGSGTFALNGAAATSWSSGTVYLGSAAAPAGRKRGR